jgi:shikimate dehydrogenase
VDLAGRVFGDLGGKVVIVIGAGKMSTLAARHLRAAGVTEIMVTNRSPERGETLAAALQCDFAPLAEAPRCSFDVLVQCTSVGLAGGPSGEILPVSVFHPGMVVMDLVYRPRWTPFLLAARDAGCATVSGLDMLLFQGVAQFEWWLGRPAPLAQMKDALLRAFSRGES